jgi:apolipoprotein N-acyltransferase
MVTLQEQTMRIFNHPAPSSKSRKWLASLLLLVAAAVSLLFSNGADTVALAAWLSPALVLRFVRTHSLRVGLPTAYLLLVAAFAFQFRGMMPIPGVAYYALLALLGIVLLAPYLVDRLLSPRLTGLAATVAFPSTYVVAEWFLSRGPSGTWGSIAYSQYGNLALLQLLSVTGPWGVTFLLGWFAAACNLVWEVGLSPARARAPRCCALESSPL